MILAALLLATLHAQNQPPKFATADRRARIERAMPKIDEAFATYMRTRGTPSIAYGVILDGELIHARALGLAQREANVAATPETRFRIASMTKSFTALAILKLRDQGKLTLEDPIAKWIPEVRNWRPATADADTIRVRHLLTHGAGFPEDNPWGDQQLGLSDAALNDWLKKGVPFSTSPGMAYEYSNYGFALLGRIVTNASGRPYKQYLEREILAPLGMSSSTLEPAEAPAAQTAIGYRLTGSEYAKEPSLAHGAFGAMGGLLTTVRDLSRYVAFQLDAYPPRDDADNGPVRRASRREMQTLWRHSGLRVNSTAAGTSVSAGGYGYGLAVAHHCAYGQLVSHGGGLPGFGSHMLWLPEYGLGFVAMTNLTYSGPTAAIMQAIEALHREGALLPRKLAPAPVLVEMQREITSIWNRWDAARAEKIAAMNLLMDQPMAERQAEVERLKRRVGACRAAGPVDAENWLRGTFRLDCERGYVHVTFTLAPTNPPRVQFLDFDAVNELRPAMRGLAESAAAFAIPQVDLAESFDRAAAVNEALRMKAMYGACRVGSTVGGDGETEAVVRLQCDRGTLDATIQREDGRIRSIRFARPQGPGCLP